MKLIFENIHLHTSQQLQKIVLGKSS